jgi:hypothetical protein
MKKFTTNMLELLSRIEEGCATADDDLLLESYETLSFYHPQAVPHRTHLRRIVALALNRRQHALADTALALLADDRSPGCERGRDTVLLIRAMNLSRHLLRKMAAVELLTALIERLHNSPVPPAPHGAITAGGSSVDVVTASANRALASVSGAPDRDFSDDQILSAPDPFAIADPLGTARRELVRLLKLIAFREASGNRSEDLR